MELKDILNKISKITDIEEIEKHIHSNKWILRQEAISRLGSIPNDKSINILIQIIKDSKDKYDLIYANSALGKLKAKSAVPELLKQINSRSRDVAQSAIYALGEIGDVSVISYLEKKRGNKVIGDYCDTAIRKLKREQRLNNDKAQ